VKPAIPREPPVAVTASVRTAPIVITPTPTPPISADPAPPISADPARDPDSLLAKTIKIKDNVVGATLDTTWRVAMTIGGIPSWISSLGDRVGGSSTNSSSTDHLVSATW
jgi:hypothetical protein